MYRDRGLVVLAFPSESFGKMDSQTPADVVAFCQSKFHVTFPIYHTCDVKGDTIDPIYQFLTKRGQDVIQGEVEFNSEKFLIGRDGQVKNRYGSFTGPMSSRLRNDIEMELGHE